MVEVLILSLITAPDSSFRVPPVTRTKGTVFEAKPARVMFRRFGAGGFVPGFGLRGGDLVILPQGHGATGQQQGRRPQYDEPSRF
jgi:hypothetical protein